MSKVSGTYPSLSRGVSQQPFEARLDGQHGEQVNMWSDPVNGLSRRRGTTMQFCDIDSRFGPSYFQLSGAQQQELREFYASYRTIPYVTDGVELQVHYPTKKHPVWMRDSGPQGGIRVTRKIQGATGIQPGAAVEPVGIGAQDVAQSNITLHGVYSGLATACQVGRYMLFFPNDAPAAYPAEVDSWASADNGDVAIEVKAGIPNRTYTVTAEIKSPNYPAGSRVSWSYTTPSSAYSGTLDTSDIPANDPEYQKKVNDRVNAYNSAVTAWITTSARQTRPAYIAEQLRDRMEGMAASLDCVAEYATNTSFIIVTIKNGALSKFAALDGGSGSDLKVTERTVGSPQDLTSFHKAGHIVQIKPDRGTGSFYVKAVVEGGQDYGKVRWEETARTTQSPIPSPFLVMAVKNPQPSPAAFRVGLAPGTPAGLEHLAGIIADPTVKQLPGINSRLVGDADSSPPPKFFGKQITWAGMFQDRLCIAAGNTIDMSEVGNYFNFFRTQTMTIPDTDHVSIYALGSEADVIRHSVIFDRSLLLFGDNQQYSIDGRNPVTPSTSTVIQSSAIEDATDCPPVAGGSLVFFGKRRESSAEVFQLEVGDVADTSNFTGLGLQLSDYLPGKPAQLLYVSSPSMLFVRCSEAPHSVFVFKFVDQNRQRILDSWSRFDYHPAFGIIYGMFYHDDALYYRVAREAWKDGSDSLWRGQAGGYGYDVLERQSLLPQLPSMPYLDSMRPVSLGWYGTTDTALDWYSRQYPFLANAFSKTNVATGEVDQQYGAWLQGIYPAPSNKALWDREFSDVPERVPEHCVAGIPFESYIELTSPVRRSQDGQPIMQGRLNVTKLDVHYRNSSGLAAVVKSNETGAVTSSKFSALPLEVPASYLGRIPVNTGVTSVFIRKEVKDYKCTLKAQTWLPLTITRVTWTGQWFLNHRFV